MDAQKCVNRLAIALGAKTQTIRRPRNRHARPGEMIQHYTGLRTKAAAKVCSDTRCIRVEPICLRFSPALGGAPIRRAPP
jgi:hypothetical protein